MKRVLWMVEMKVGRQWIATVWFFLSRKEARNCAQEMRDVFYEQIRIVKYVSEGK